MSSLLKDKASNIRLKANDIKHITITELARSTSWRKELPVCDVIEIVDRGNSTGWLVSVKGMNALLETINVLEEELEQYKVQSIINTRNEYNNWRTGEELSKEALALFKSDRHKIESVINDD